MIKSNMKLKSTQAGQAVIESILIISVFLGITSIVASGFRDNEVLRNLVSGPWVSIASMISNGNWEKKGSKDIHPNYHLRHVTHSGADPTPKP